MTFDCIAWAECVLGNNRTCKGLVNILAALGPIITSNVCQFISRIEPSYAFAIIYKINCYPEAGIGHQAPSICDKISSE